MLVQHTPMIQQYLEIKENYKDAIVFFRLGDFYEMFFEDAQIASKELEIVLTARDGGAKKIPMCGVPHHSSNSYIYKLINKGYKVAICEQVEDPKDTKGIVKREVVRVITPGTIIDEIMLDEGNNNYLASLVESNGIIGFAYIDVSTGEFWVTEFAGNDRYSQVENELLRLSLAECLIDDSNQLINEINVDNKVYRSYNLNEYGLSNIIYAEKLIFEHFNITSLVSFGIEDYSSGILAIASILKYLSHTHKSSLQHIKIIKTFKNTSFMELDYVTRKNLELTMNMKDRKKEGTVLNIIDTCCTAMGKRTLRQWLEKPLTDLVSINNRLDSVEELINNIDLRNNTRELLNKVYDLERLVGRVGSELATPKDLLAIKKSIEILPELKNLYKQSNSYCLQKMNLIDALEDIYNLLHNSIDDNAPAVLKEGNIIKDNYNIEIDELKELSKRGNDWLIKYEQTEKERTGLKYLKIGYNKVFGYYLEVSKSNLSLVPNDYIRKQTLVNTERFITNELKEFETKILTSKDKLVEKEYELFIEIRRQLSLHIVRIQETATQIAYTDALYSLAQTAYNNDYVRPNLNTKGEIIINSGRHPVIEKTLKNARFVPNNVNLNMEDSRFLLITGPNMGGKSTYMRQTALIVIMAQIGSFVPVKEATISIVDRIFTRVGASDDLASGHSTFMMEMVEVVNIINNATENSLIILDEIGRGTSTYDGLSIAKAVSEYIYQYIGAKTLFATHYHELTSLADEYSGIKNLSVSVLDSGEQVVFLKKVLPGKADKSYGIHVAKLAGLPNKVISRANDILLQLENNSFNRVKEITQPNLFTSDEHPIVKELENINPDDLTAKDALLVIYKLKELLQTN